MNAAHSPGISRTIRLLATIGSLWLLWTVYALIVPEPEDKVPDSLDVLRYSLDSSPVAQHMPDLLDALDVILQSPITKGNLIEPLINGDEIFLSMLTAIRNAEHSIHLLSYIYWSGQIADEFATALIEAADRGVDVRLIVDGFGARSMPTELFDRLEKRGVQAVWFHPFKWYNIRHFNLRTHRKVMVVDSNVAFTGGVGIADEWTGDARDASEWRDDHFRIEGPAVRVLAGSFAENWLNATGKLLVTKSQSLLGNADEGSKKDDTTVTRAMVLSTSPRGDMSPIAFSYWTAMQLATSSVNIATPYFVPDAALAQALVETAQRGVSVNLLLPGEHNDSWLVRYASFAFYDDLVNSGVAVYEYQPTMMHTKAIVVDDRWSLFGSPNFDNRSFELNDEILVVADDRRLANALNASFDVDISRAKRVVLDDTRLTYWMRQWVAHALLLFREQI